MYRKNYNKADQSDAMLFFAKCDLHIIKKITGLNCFQSCEDNEEKETRFNRVLYTVGGTESIVKYLLMEFNFEASTVTINGNTLNILKDERHEFTYKKTRGKNIIAINGIEGFYDTVVSFMNYRSAFWYWFLGTLEKMFKVSAIEPRFFGLKIQCTDDHGKTGTFLFDRITGKQFSETYRSAAELFEQPEYKAVRQHVI